MTAEMERSSEAVIDSVRPKLRPEYVLNLFLMQTKAAVDAEKLQEALGRGPSPGFVCHGYAVDHDPERAEKIYPQLFHSYPLKLYALARRPMFFAVTAW
jgi:hypothetical protein